MWLNTRSFNLVINAWAKSRRGDEAVNRLMTLLTEIERSGSMVSPDLLSYSGVILCIVKGERFGAQ